MESCIIQDVQNLFLLRRKTKNTDCTRKARPCRPELTQRDPLRAALLPRVELRAGSRLRLLHIHQIDFSRILLNFSPFAFPLLIRATNTKTEILQAEPQPTNRPKSLSCFIDCPAAEVVQEFSKLRQRNIKQRRHRWQIKYRFRTM